MDAKIKGTPFSYRDKGTFNHPNGGAFEIEVLGVQGLEGKMLLFVKRLDLGKEGHIPQAMWSGIVIHTPAIAVGTPAKPKPSFKDRYICLECNTVHGKYTCPVCGGTDKISNPKMSDETHEAEVGRYI